jgi:GNAT superfamily N-acetyltransferase
MSIIDEFRFSEEDPIIIEPDRTRIQTCIFQDSGIFVNYDHPDISMSARRIRSGEVIGLAEIKLYDYKKGEFYFMVHPSCQGLGIGTELLRRSVCQAKEHGLLELGALAIPNSVSEMVLLDNDFCDFDPGAIKNWLLSPRSFLRLNL